MNSLHPLHRRQLSYQTLPSYCEVMCLSLSVANDSLLHSIQHELSLDNDC